MIREPNVQVAGRYCKATNVKVSSIDPNWVYGVVGLYNARGEPASDTDEAMVNLTTHELIGPTNVGMCGAGPDHNQPIGAYGSVPADVLADLGLHPCTPTGRPPNTPSSVATSGPAATTAPTPSPSAAASSSNATTTFQTFAGPWEAHVERLMITPSGRGHLIFPNLGACPSCAQGTAPVGTLDFVLQTVVRGVGIGVVTSSADTKLWAVGDPVTVKLSPGSPGQLLIVTIARKQLTAFCNKTSTGQCGA